MAEQLTGALPRYVDLVTIVNRRGKKALPIFLPYALLAALWLVWRRRVDAVLLADALLAPLGCVLKCLGRVPVAATVCGLDIRYQNRFYQAVIPGALARLDMMIPISRATETEALARTGSSTPSTVVPLGVNRLPDPGETGVRDFRERLGVNGGPVVLTAGRLIKRKGVAWFVECVLPSLPEDTTYVVIGSGAEADAIRAAARRAGVEDRMRLLGRVPDDELSAAYRSADVFVMPNVPIPGDMEGFGLVALEAAAAGLPVVASRLEGITDAVQHERNGILVAPQVREEFSSALHEVLALGGDQRRMMGQRFRTYTLEHYGWHSVARRYADIMSALIEKRK